MVKKINSHPHLVPGCNTVLINGFWVAAATEIASEDFDILIVVSKAKFEKKLWQKILVNNWKLHKIGSVLAKSGFGYSISFQILL
jgi:hypothetical protein